MFTLAVYDKFGRPVAWKDGSLIFNIDGKQLPIFINNETLFSFNGKYLGYFSSGFFRDKKGNAVACTRFAIGGPLLPLFHHIDSIFLDFPAAPNVNPMPPVFPLSSLEWSNITWKEFINGEKLVVKNETPIQQKPIGRAENPKAQPPPTFEDDFGIIYPNS